MLYKLLNKLDSTLHFPTVTAHCDIPCKVYDPITAQIAALTMIRLVDLLNIINAESDLSANDLAQFSRLVAQKEAHGKKVKEEISVIWGDFIKTPQLEKFPEIHALVHSIMLATSTAKQHINKDKTIILLEKVNRFAEIFWHCKGYETYSAICPYPPEQKVIYPVLTA